MVCPFIDSNDARCAVNFKLDRIDYAVGVCADDFAQCPLFWELLEAKARLDREHAAPAA